MRCADGSYGIRREEVWERDGRVIRYNLAFIHHRICQKDNGRVLGYDNAHGTHERHWMGSVEQTEFTCYEDALARFQSEIDAIRRLR